MSSQTPDNRVSLERRTREFEDALALLDARLRTPVSSSTPWSASDPSGILTVHVDHDGPSVSISDLVVPHRGRRAELEEAIAHVLVASTRHARAEAMAATSVPAPALPSPPDAERWRAQMLETLDTIDAEYDRQKARLARLASQGRR